MKIKCYHIVGFLFTSIVGTLLHFTYEWSGSNPIIALFSPVNESVWEHLKLLFFPMMIYAIYEYFSYGKDIPNFIPAKFISILFGLSFIVIVYYTYVGILGKNITWVDISLFFVSVLLSYLINYLILNTEGFTSDIAKYISIIGLTMIATLFILYTNNPPNIPLFLDPLTGRYGI